MQKVYATLGRDTEESLAAAEAEAARLAAESPTSVTVEDAGFSPELAEVPAAVEELVASRAEDTLEEVAAGVEFADVLPEQEFVEAISSGESIPSGLVDASAELALPVELQPEAAAGE